MLAHTKVCLKCYKLPIKMTVLQEIYYTPQLLPHPPPHIPFLSHTNKLTPLMQPQLLSLSSSTPLLSLRFCLNHFTSHKILTLTQHPPNLFFFIQVTPTRISFVSPFTVIISSHKRHYLFQ